MRGIERHHAAGPEYPRNTSATRLGSRGSRSKWLLSSIAAVSGRRRDRRVRRAAACGPRLAEADLHQVRRRHGVESASALGQPPETVVVMHHGLAVGGDLEVDLDAVIAVNGGRHGARRVLDDAAGGIVQPAMRDRAPRQPFRLRMILSENRSHPRRAGRPSGLRERMLRTPRTVPRPRPRHRSAARRRRPWCGRAGPCRQRRPPSGRRRRSSPSALRGNPGSS